MTFAQLWTAIKTIGGKIVSGVSTAVSEVDKVAPLVEGITGAISPSAAAAEATVVSILNAVETAIAAVEGAATSGPITVTLGAEIVADFKAAKAAIQADLAALGIGAAPNTAGT
jgi:hypothetical protein